MGELVSDRVIRFPNRTWDELEGLPQPLRNAAHGAIFHLLEEPVPTLADPFPEVDPLPGSYRLHLPSDGLTIWYRSEIDGMVWAWLAEPPHSGHLRLPSRERDLGIR